MFGVDAVRYIMLHEMPYNQDGTVTHELMIERINADLNTLGNLVNLEILPWLISILKVQSLIKK